MKENEFLSLVSSPLMNLDHTYRYSGTKLVEPESLSQHVIDTIMMGLKIIDKVNFLSNRKLLDDREFLLKAVYHDLEEIITGDVPRPLKYHDESTLSSLRGVADEVAHDLFKKEFCGAGTHYDIWESAKDGKEGYILKIVDMLVVANKVVKEVSLLNNNYMLRVAHEVTSYLKEQTEYLDNNIVLNNLDAEFYIKRLLQDAQIAMEEILEEHKSLTDKFNLYTQSMI